MSVNKPTYEELELKVKSLEHELEIVNNKIDSDFKDFVQYSKSIFYKYSSIRGGLFWSDSVQEIIGFEPDEIKNNPFLWHNSIHPDDKHEVQKAIKDYGKGRDYYIEYRIKSKSGKWIWLLDNFIHKRQIGEEIIIDGNAYDITQQKETERALKESEELFKNYLNSTSDIVFVLDKDQRHIGVYGDWVERSGLTKSFFLGRTPQEILGDKAEIHMQANEKALRGENFAYEWNSELNGTINYYQTSLSPLYKENQIVGIIGVGRNITNLKKIEFELRESEEKYQAQNLQLEKLNGDKNRFISILAHDLKSPFSSILSALEIVLEKLSKSEITDSLHLLNMINQSAQRYYVLLNEILEWARTQASNIYFTVEKTSIQIIFTELIENIQPSLDKKNITLEADFKNFEYIHCDRKIISTVLRNLINNAIKFTNLNGKIKIELEKKGNEIIFSVSDNGIGISSERLASLFDMSQMQSTLGTSKEKGTGLGLLLCKELIEKLKGRLWAESELGKGSKFHFAIPLELDVV